MTTVELSGPPRTEVQLLSTEAVADLLGVTTRTVRRFASQGKLTKVALTDRLIRYRLVEVRALVDDAQVGSVQDDEREAPQPRAVKKPRERARRDSAAE